MINIRLLLIFFGITTTGSALSGISAFLSLDNYFHSTILLAIALSARTFSGFLFSYYSNKIIKFLGIKKSLIISQIFGLFALFVLSLGFYLNNFLIALFGIMITCLPSVFIFILLSILFRLDVKNENKFRKYSGSRELIAGIAGISAAILSPLMLLKLNISTICVIDGITYLLGIILLKGIQLSSTYVPIEAKDSQLHNGQILLRSGTLVFLFQTSASLLLAGLVPLVASAQHMSLTENLPTLIREWFWSIDQIAAIVASSIYIAYTNFIKKSWLTPILILNSIWLIIPLFLNSHYSLLVIVLISLLLQISFQKFRDDFVLSVEENVELIYSYSAIAFAQKNFVYFLSPLILGIVFILPTLLAILLIIAIQIILYLLFKITIKYAKTTNILYNNNIKIPISARTIAKS